MVADGQCGQKLMLRSEKTRVKLIHLLSQVQLQLCEFSKTVDVWSTLEVSKVFFSFCSWSISEIKRDFYSVTDLEVFIQNPGIGRGNFCFWVQSFIALYLGLLKYQEESHPKKSIISKIVGPLSLKLQYSLWYWITSILAEGNGIMSSLIHSLLRE